MDSTAILVNIASLIVSLIFIFLFVALLWYIVWYCYLSRFKFVRELLGRGSDPNLPSSLVDEAAVAQNSRRRRISRRD